MKQRLGYTPMQPCSHLHHNRVSLFPSSSVEAAKDLQHKRPRSMEAIGQALLHNTAIQYNKRE